MAEGPSLGLGPLSRIRLDELLQELLDNARLYALAQRRERRLAATAEITGVLLGTVRRTEALRLIARRAREISGAGLVMVLLHDEPNARWDIEAADGADLAGRSIPDAAFPRTVEDLGAAAEWPDLVPDGPALTAPLAAATRRGVLIVTQPAGRAFDDEDAVLLSTFAGQAALALERARAQEEREQPVVLEDRERIARDLHDVVIRRLFATGMQLQGALAQLARPEAARRINAAVDDLDATIRDIRRSIFELRPGRPVAARLTARRGRGGRRDARLPAHPGHDRPGGQRRPRGHRPRTARGALRGARAGAGRCRHGRDVAGAHRLIRDLRP